MNTFEIKHIDKMFPGRRGEFILECYDFLRDIVPFDEENIFVSGGFFARRWIGAPIRDIDVYVNGHESYLENVMEEYRTIGYIVKKQYQKTYDGEESGRSLHYVCEKENEPKIDLIAFHKPKSILHIDTFDLNIVQIAMTEDYIHYPDFNLFEEFENKRMQFTGNVFMRTFERIIKYTKLGYTMEEEETSQVRIAFIEKIKQMERDRRRAAG